MADSEEYYGIQFIAEEINDAYEDIKKVRRALFGRLKEENMKSSVTKTQKRELRVLWRHMNRAYKKLTQEPEDYSLTRKQIGKLTVPWTMYLVALMRIKEEIFKHEHVDEGDEGATIHGPDYAKTYERKMEPTLTDLLNNLKVAHSRS